MTDTPYLRVDDDVLRDNIDRMSDWAAEQGLLLRPHAKTHKCVQVAQRQIDAGAIGLTVATVGEAEAFANAGFTDLFLAYPLWPSPEKAQRLRLLSSHTSLRVGVDSAESARALAAGLGRGAGAIETVVEVDSGMRRSGVAPERAGAVASAAADAGLNVVGVFTFPGHGYGPGSARRDAAGAEAHALAEAAEALRYAGIVPHVISGGSTPTVEFADPGVLTEIRPGVYPFNDAQQVELGSCGVDDVSLAAIATVVSVAADGDGERIVLDSGSKTLGADRPAWTTGFGRLPDFPDARIVSLSEHHAVVENPVGAAGLPGRGEQVRVIPNHVCSAVNLADELVAATATGFERWPLIARGANS
ncbi:MAG: alanine racemase [Gordonia sp. (in: high G+C Gram-positive bacteria)]|uniref:alanine racemase n=1 Tax=Gordonia sp. (in: high G+C Gram-positive bacteria) TaxID=84139 RepID=UPI0039E5EA65